MRKRYAAVAMAVVLVSVLFAACDGREGGTVDDATTTRAMTTVGSTLDNASESGVSDSDALGSSSNATS